VQAIEPVTVGSVAETRHVFCNKSATWSQDRFIYVAKRVLSKKQVILLKTYSFYGPKNSIGGQYPLFAGRGRFVSGRFTEIGTHAAHWPDYTTAPNLLSVEAKTRANQQSGSHHPTLNNPPPQ
jgi:hypothetical protein